MRRCLALVGLLAVGGCSNFRSLFSARTNAAAEVGGQPLTAERLSQMLTANKGLQPTREVADYVTQLWVDYALFAEAAVNDKLPMDSASIAQALWAELAERRGTRWHDTLMARRSAAGPAQLDSLYQGDGVRVLQHILFRVPPAAVAQTRAVARKKADAALARVRGGADFGGVAAQLSEDPSSRPDSGFLPPSPRGQFVGAFDSAGWALAPGGTSKVVETPFGYHIIKRPPAAAVRSRLANYLAQSSARRLDSIYMDSIAVANKITVDAGAPVAMKTALADLDQARRSTKVLATYKDGTLTVGEFVRWIQVLPPQYSARLKEVPDSVLKQFARVLSQNALLLDAADAAGIRISASEWAALVQQHRTQIDSLRSALALTGPELNSSTMSAAERNKAAVLKVDQYFDNISGGKRRMQPITPAFAAVLRDRGTYRVYPAGVARALELAKAATQPADSTRPAGPLQRAPGPPPIPQTEPPADSAAHE